MSSAAGPFAVCASRIVTADPARATVSDPLGVVEDHAVVIEGGRVLDVCPRAELAARHPAARVEIDAPGRVVTPGLVDAHTHAPWTGSRDDEYALRMAGAGYEAIAARGGGIVSTMKAVRAVSPQGLAAELRARVRRMARMGVTTVEAKSGYGLDEPSERKQLEAIAEVARAPDVPRLVPTYLALHALPPEAAGDRDAYAKVVAERWLPAIAAAGLARWVDAYVDRSAFSTAQAEPVLRRARELGLGVRAHIGQFADVGGAELAASLGAASVDHVEHVGQAGIEALARAGTAAVLLPVASFTLRQAPPPVARLREARIPLVVASDANPGTAPTESLPLAMALAVASYGMPVAEVVLGVTREAARSLGLTDAGSLCRGARADVCVWDLPSENAIVQPWGGPRTLAVYRDGVRID